MVAVKSVKQEVHLFIRKSFSLSFPTHTEKFVRCLLDVDNGW